MATKRKDKTRKPKYLSQAEEDQNEVIGGLAKSFLLLVEGDTEEAYFEKLKNNPWLNNSLAGVEIECCNDIKEAIEKSKLPENIGKQIWLVRDNDKRNAFVLEKEETPFFSKTLDNYLPREICDDLMHAYNPDKHNYFLSVYDYLKWLQEAIGSENIVEYWDKIQDSTLKKREFEKFFHPNQQYDGNLRLAYSCIAFEFWLILHFEQNDTPFLWVDKGKPDTVDAVTYLQTLQPDYDKGYFDKNLKQEKPCHAYNCLYPDFQKNPQTKDDEWQVLIRIVDAIMNAEWLRNRMKPILERQSGKWYEVNPYIKGLDELMKELLNIKPLEQEIEYFGLNLIFNFDFDRLQLALQIAVNDGNAFSVEPAKAPCFEIKNRAGESFLPVIEMEITFPNEYQPVLLHYELPPPEENYLILIFKDPRRREK